jgi:hypothetical protein
VTIHPSFLVPNVLSGAPKTNREIAENAYASVATGDLPAALGAIGRAPESQPFWGWFTHGLSAVATLLPSSSTSTPFECANSADPPRPGRHLIGRPSAYAARMAIGRRPRTGSRSSSAGTVSSPGFPDRCKMSDAVSTTDLASLWYSVDSGQGWMNPSREMESPWQRP